MLNKMSRTLLIFITIIVAAIILPYYFWMAFEVRIFNPSITYSSISHKILTGKYLGLKYQWLDEDGTLFTRGQADSLTPLSNFIQLAAWGKMPTAIDGVPINIDDVRINRFLIRYRPFNLDNPLIPLYPLFESRPQRLKLELPREMFRFNDRMEFITAQSNEINEDLTKGYTEKLTSLNFQFPVKKVFGNTTTKKPFDEGYFIIDQANQFFHIKMIQGKVFCKSVPVPENLLIRYMIVYEHNIREFYGLVITEDNRLYFLMMDNYRFQPLPIEDFDAEENKLILKGNLFYRIFNIISPGKAHTIVIDRKFKKIADHNTKWETNEDMWMGMISQYLFPVSITFRDRKSALVDFYMDGYHLRSLYLGVILTGLLFFIRNMRRKRIGSWLDYPVTLFFGLFGLIAVLIFEDFE